MPGLSSEFWVRLRKCEARTERLIAVVLDLRRQIRALQQALKDQRSKIN
jgi:hypothetical protein